MTIQQDYQKEFIYKIERILTEAYSEKNNKLVAVANYLNRVAGNASTALNIAGQGFTGMFYYSAAYGMATLGGIVTVGGIYVSIEATKLKNIRGWINNQNQISDLAIALSNHMVGLRGDDLGVEQAQDNTLSNILMLSNEQLQNLNALSIIEKQAHIDVQKVVDILEKEIRPATGLGTKVEDTMKHLEQLLNPLPPIAASATNKMSLTTKFMNKFRVEIPNTAFASTDENDNFLTNNMTQGTSLTPRQM